MEKTEGSKRKHVGGVIAAAHCRRVFLPGLLPRAVVGHDGGASVIATPLTAPVSLAAIEAVYLPCNSKLCLGTVRFSFRNLGVAVSSATISDGKQTAAALVCG